MSGWKPPRPPPPPPPGWAESERERVRAAAVAATQAADRARLLAAAPALATILLAIVTETTRPPARPFADVSYLKHSHLQAALAALAAAGVEVPT